MSDESGGLPRFSARSFSWMTWAYSVAAGVLPRVFTSPSFEHPRGDFPIVHRLAVAVPVENVLRGVGERQALLDALRRSARATNAGRGRAYGRRRTEVV